MSRLFSPLRLSGLTLKNRVVMGPTCMYSARDGYADDYHLVHLGRFALGGFGTVMTEAVAVSPEGRITHGCLGLWNEEQIEPLARICRFVENNGAVPAIQLSHAGRKGSVSAMALEFCILTAARSGEVLNARWSEIDLKEAIWTVPAERMKAGREHRVPLGQRAVAILKALQTARHGDFVFPGAKLDRPLSVMSMTTELKGYDLRNGERAGVVVAVHPDTRVQMVMELVRERQTGQLIDRLRLLYPDERSPRIIVLSNLPIPGLTVDELVILSDLLDGGGSCWGMALEALDGAVPLQAKFLADTFALSIDFGPLRSAAKKIEELKRQPWRRPVGTSIVQYRRNGTRGPASSALVYTGIDDPASAIAASHGLATSDINVVAPQTEKLCNLPIDILCERTGFFRLSDTEQLWVVPRPGSKGSWRIIARQLAKPLDALRKRYSTPEGLKSLEAGYWAPGSFWRLHLEGERYAVDIKLPGVAEGDKRAALERLKIAGLNCTWVIPANALNLERRHSTRVPKMPRVRLTKPKLQGVSVRGGDTDLDPEETSTLQSIAAYDA